MLDNETIKSGLELLNLATTAIKGVVGLASATTNLEIKRQSDEALEMIFEAKQKYFDLQEDYFELGRQNRELKAELEKTKSYVFHHSVNWRVCPDGTEDGPFCPVCASEGPDMRLMLHAGVDQTGEVLHMFCPKSHIALGEVRDFTRGKEPSYSIPKGLVPESRYFVRP
jgi:hypothetical protein